MERVPVFYHESYSALRLPEGHRFPIGKYRALFESLTGLPVEPRVPEPAPVELITAVHDPGYVDAVLNGGLDDAASRRMGFPWSPALAERTLLSVGGTVGAARAALESGCALQTSGGYHHAHAGYGAGYCVFNDLAVAAAAVLREGRCGRVLVLDLDAHQGDGTAELCAGREGIVTVSLHGARLFPARKASSTLDWPLPAGVGDGAYLDILERALGEALARGRPDLILYQAGVDVCAGDLLGDLGLGAHGLRARDRRVFSFARDEGIPIAAVPGGGYRRDWRELARLHRIAFEEAATAFARPAR